MHILLLYLIAKCVHATAPNHVKTKPSYSLRLCTIMPSKMVPSLGNIFTALNNIA